MPLAESSVRTELGTQTQSKKHADLIRKAEFDPWTALPTWS
jgi:hypothetical protein